MIQRLKRTHTQHYFLNAGYITDTPRGRVGYAVNASAQTGTNGSWNENATEHARVYLIPSFTFKERFLVEAWEVYAESSGNVNLQVR